MDILSRAEELALLAVCRLKDNAYGVTIRDTIIQFTGSEWSVGAIYDTLERLERKGHLSAVLGDPTPERGGRSKRYYQITRQGYTALFQTKNMHESMWEGLIDLGIDPS